MELPDQKDNAKGINLSDAGFTNLRESLKNFPHASLPELEDLFVLLFA